MEEEHRVLIAPASFKGSLSAAEAARCMALGVIKRRPKAECRLLPLADGGEGTLHALVGLDAPFKETIVQGPMGQPVSAKWAYLPGTDTAVIESAQALGLPSVPVHRRDPLLASSEGLGQLMKAAVQDGAKTLLIGLGGVATSDGGLGMLQALGARVKTASGDACGRGGQALFDVATIEIDDARTFLADVSIQVLTDVAVPLLGNQGASQFMEQKGATPDQRRHLTKGLERLSSIAMAQTPGHHYHDISGAGAAGGLGFGLAWLGGILVPGSQFVAHQINLRAHVEWASIILSGEGAIDTQTLEGKALMPLAALAVEHQKPMIALCGSKPKDTERLAQKGFTSVFSVGCGGESVVDMMADAKALVVSAAFEIAGLLPHLASHAEKEHGFDRDKKN